MLAGTFSNYNLTRTRSVVLCLQGVSVAGLPNMGLVGYSWPSIRFAFGAPDVSSGEKIYK